MSTERWTTSGIATEVYREEYGEQSVLASGMSGYIAAQGVADDGRILVECPEPQRRADMRIGINPHQWDERNEVDMRTLVKRELRRRLKERGETTGWLVVDPYRDNTIGEARHLRWTCSGASPSRPSQGERGELMSI